MRRLALALLGGVALVAACEDRVPSPRPDFGLRDPEPPAVRLPTPTPPPEGAWALTVGSSGDGCGFATPPDVVHLAGSGIHWQIALQPFFLDAQGLLEDEYLELRGSATRNYRPTRDCVLEEQDVWALERIAPETLEGELLRLRDHRAGDECALVLGERAELPCIARWEVRLEHRAR